VETKMDLLQELLSIMLMQKIEKRRKEEDQMMKIYSRQIENLLLPKFRRSKKYLRMFK